jgi:MFS family permease
VLIFGLFVGIGHLLMSQVHTTWHLYLIYGLVIGLGISSVNSPLLSTVARWFHKYRAMMGGIVQAGQGIGGMVLSPIAAWLILTYGWRPAFVVLGIIALAFIIFPGLLLKRDPTEMGISPYGAIQSDRKEARNVKMNPPRTGFSLREAIRTKQFWMISLIVFGYGFCRASAIVHVAAHVTDLKFSLTVGANALAIMSACAVLGKIGMGYIADSTGNRSSYMIGFALMAASLLWALVANELWMLYLFAVIFGFSWGTMAMARMPLIVDVFGFGSLSTVIGFSELCNAAGSAIGPLLAGFLFDMTGKYASTFIVSAAMCVTCLIAAALLGPIRKGENNALAK